MLFKFLFASAVSQSFGMRPEGGNSRSTTLARLGEVVASAAHTVAAESMQSLQEASGIVNSILLQSGNATDHMTDDDVALLNSVIAMIDNTIYGSMDSSHDADAAAIAAAIADVGQCNSDHVARIAVGGDLYGLQRGAISFQNVLYGLQDTLDAETADNNTKWSELSSHMSMISAPPACAELPERTKPALDVYFEKSDYVNWYTAQQASYGVVNSAFEAADGDLDAAQQAYAVGLAQRDTSFCDWKTELEAGCGSFDVCFQSKSDAYLVTLKPALEADMQARIEAYKAGQTIIAQVNFLLGESTESAPPTDIDTSRFQLTFQDAPPKGECDLSPLTSPVWEPVPNCQNEEPCACVDTNAVTTNCGLTGGFDLKMWQYRDNFKVEFECMDNDACIAALLEWHGAGATGLDGCKTNSTSPNSFSKYVLLDGTKCFCPAQLCDAASLDSDDTPVGLSTCYGPR